MNALTASAAEASFTETHPGRWVVILGHESRTITQEGPAWFIAWLGRQEVCWCFSKALAACVEDIEFRVSEAARSQREHDEAIAALARMSPAEKASAIEALTAQRDWLDWSGSEVDVVARKAAIGKRIAHLRAI